MRRRLRKKLHKGEFRELVFEVEFRLKKTLTQEEQLAFMDECINHGWSNGIELGPGGSCDRMGAWVAARGGCRVVKTLIDQDRTAVIAYLEAHPLVAKPVLASPLYDGWYDTTTQDAFWEKCDAVFGGTA